MRIQKVWAQYLRRPVPRRARAATAALGRFVNGRLVPEVAIYLGLRAERAEVLQHCRGRTAPGAPHRPGGPEIASPTLEEWVQQMALQPRGRDAMLH